MAMPPCKRQGSCQQTRLQMNWYHWYRQTPHMPAPVKKLAVVESVVVWTVLLGMVGWCQHSSLVTVDCIVAEEMLHLHIVDGRTATTCEWS